MSDKNKQLSEVSDGPARPLWLREFSEQLSQHLSQLSDDEVPDTENPCDEKVQDERSTFDQDKQKWELARLRAELTSLEQDTKLRKAFAWAGYWMNIGWLVAILSLLFLSGFHCWRFSLPDSVLLALIGTTTTNVIGVLLIVMRYLFPKTSTK